VLYEVIQAFFAASRLYSYMVHYYDPLSLRSLAAAINSSSIYRVHTHRFYAFH
jgi:hypothetical protein